MQVGTKISVEVDSILAGAEMHGRGNERQIGFGGFAMNSERVSKGRRGRRKSA